MFYITRQFNTVRKRWFWGVLSVAVFSIFLYGYFVNATVIAVVLQESNQKQIRELTADMSELEHRYAQLQKTITREEARALSFVPPTERIFAERQRLARNQSKDLSF